MDIFSVCRGVEHCFIIYLSDGIVTIVILSADTTRKVTIARAKNLTTQVITTIDIISHIWESVGTNDGLGMALDVSITRACKGIEDTSVIQVDASITRYRTLETATIEKLCLGNIL